MRNSVTRARVRKRRDVIFRENEDGVWTQTLTEKLSRTGLSTSTNSKVIFSTKKIVYLILLRIEK